MEPNIEVLIHRDAPWAPTVSGVQFTWAWRVRTESTEVSGAVTGDRQEAVNAAAETAERLRSVLKQTRVDYRGFTVSEWKSDGGPRGPRPRDS